MARDEPWSYQPLPQDYGPSLIDLPTDTSSRKHSSTFSSTKGSSSVTETLYQRRSNISRTRKTPRPSLPVPETDPEYPDMVVEAWVKAIEKEARETATAAVAAVAGDAGEGGGGAQATASSLPIASNTSSIEDLAAADAFARMSRHQEHFFVDDDGSDDDGPNAHARLRYMRVFARACVSLLSTTDPIVLVSLDLHLLLLLRSSCRAI